MTAAVVIVGRKGKLILGSRFSASAEDGEILAEVIFLECKLKESTYP